MLSRPRVPLSIRFFCGGGGSSGLKCAPLFLFVSALPMHINKILPAVLGMSASRCRLLATMEGQGYCAPLCVQQEAAVC